MELDLLEVSKVGGGIGDADSEPEVVVANLANLGVVSGELSEPEGSFRSTMAAIGSGREFNST